MEYFEVLLSLASALGLHSLSKLGPAVYEGLKRSGKYQAIKLAGDPWILVEYFAQDLFEIWRLNNDGINVKLLATIETFLLPRNQGILLSFLILGCLFGILWVLVEPLCSASVENSESATTQKRCK